MAIFSPSLGLLSGILLAGATVFAAPILKPVAAVTPQLETAVVSGGCFWGMEEVYRKLPGIKKTTVGYSGGQTEDPTYDQVGAGSTGHAESIEVEYDPAVISYEQVLTYFFRMHDPTTLNRQGNDIGSQYRSEIFYLNDGQKKAAEKVIKEVNSAKKWPKPIVTAVAPLKKFYAAEDFHQKYLIKNPNGYNHHFLRW